MWNKHTIPSIPRSHRFPLVQIGGLRSNPPARDPLELEKERMLVISQVKSSGIEKGGSKGAVIFEKKYQGFPLKKDLHGYYTLGGFSTS